MANQLRIASAALRAQALSPNNSRNRPL